MLQCYKAFGFFLLLPTITNAYKILIIAGGTSLSHYNVFEPIIKELANRKHDVTVQSFRTLRQALPNVKELNITPSGTITAKEIQIEFFRQSLVVGPIQQMRNYEPFKKNVCKGYLNDNTTKSLLASGMQYDLVLVDIMFGDCLAAVGSLVGKHLMCLYACTWAPWKENVVPKPLSYVPNFMSLLPTKMNFLQRLENTLTTIGVRYIYSSVIEANQQEALFNYLPQAGTLEEIEKKVVFSITNADPVVNSPRPSMPNVVNCGGMHCRKTDPLPKELEDFVQNTGEDGFIIFTLGTNMKSEYLTSEEIQAIVSAFSRLKQNVVWKFEGNLENIPKNVKIMEWMPQQDLLGHPKARLLITHAGLLSLQEAIYHGVPVLGIPFFADQRGNIIRMKELGIGEHFDFMNLRADEFFAVITRVLRDKSYYENMTKYSAIFKDQPERPVDRAVFWMEYVIRHDGARHLRPSSEDLNFFQYFLLDVIGFLLLVAIVVLVLNLYIVKIILVKFSGRKHISRKLKIKHKQT